MNIYKRVDAAGYEEIVRCDNKELGFVGFIAIHNTNRGPALGGVRVWNYEFEKDALTDVLRLSRAMTYKNALAKLPLGGGKGVIKTDLEKVDRTALFRAFGDFVETFDGRYITAEDVNSTLEDMTVIKQQTSHVATVGASGNPSPFTAYGVYCAIKASVRFRLGRDSLTGLTVAIQGVGETGSRLARLLGCDGCNIIAADINDANLDRLAQDLTFTRVAPDRIYSTRCDVFAPCAMGGILNSNTIPKLACPIVAGSANNQLEEDQDGVRLLKRGILFAPDYAANAGGVINISCELGGSYDPEKAMHITAQIEKTMLDIFREAKKRGLPPAVIADLRAEQLFSLKAAA
ncbi:Glu/Leu/Phe/Val family dehydrogenase [Desulforhopalus singaporensis]|uniref:Leucine dehydrogenase n=1 Tax=Desulforhopalus singaporensis TaxID=91360 RepID=A0A1H0L9F6_9BACT|nr:Glu/Leu/Phe/Val dehydrogenase dimerization domain-containing protein [Desulforhopalus singaporensis]SDO64686.1 leucine dehydrogenase [Desulforhopalus singaporensis]